MNPNARFIDLLLLSLSLHQPSNLIIFFDELWREFLISDFFNRVSPSNYRKTVKETKELIEILNIYESDFDEILSREDKFSLKHIKQAFIKKDPDFEIIFKDAKFRKILSANLTTPKKFNGLLDEKIKKMTKKMNIKLSYIDAIKKVFLNKNFQKDVGDIVAKYTKS